MMLSVSILTQEKESYTYQGSSLLFLKRPKLIYFPKIFLLQSISERL